MDYILLSSSSQLNPNSVMYINDFKCKLPSGNAICHAQWVLDKKEEKELAVRAEVKQGKKKQTVMWMKKGLEKPKGKQVTMSDHYYKTIEDKFTKWSPKERKLISQYFIADRLNIVSPVLSQVFMKPKK